MEAPLGHTPVLVREVLHHLRVDRDQVVVDLTIGLAGHASLFTEFLGADGLLIGLDVDPNNLVLAQKKLENAPCRVRLYQANFTELGDVLQSAGVASVEVLFADLGISSTQVDDGARGFSFLHDGPLDMRMDPRLTATAADLVNRLSDRELGDLLFFNAQETQARRIARAICEARRDRRITTTRQLATLVTRSLGIADEFSRKSKTHPATRTFQALRMAVNREMQNLSTLLAMAPNVLRPGGRFGVISFHSVEDKLVKTDFRRRKTDGVYNILTAKPVVAGPEERDANPRSRSAKLRVASRCGA